MILRSVLFVATPYCDLYNLPEIWSVSEKKIWNFLNSAGTRIHGFSGEICSVLENKIWSLVPMIYSRYFPKIFLVGNKVLSAEFFLVRFLLQLRVTRNFCVLHIMQHGENYEIFWNFDLLPPRPNVIYSRFWYAFSLFLRTFHSGKPLNGFCRPGRAQFAEETMEIPSQVVSKTFSILFSVKFGPFSNTFRGRARWTCEMNLFMSWLV